MAKEDGGPSSAGAASEVRRRAGILRRYVAIDMPSLDDDERFAAELGLARDTLYQLARSWRLHADPSLLPGSFTRTASADRGLAYAATERPDLSGVLPTRRAAVAARIAGLRDFLTIEAPDRRDETAAAAGLGLSLGTFRRLHRSWMLTRDPASLPGASRAARVPQRRRPKVPPEVDRHIAAVIAEHGPRAKALAIHREVAGRCAAEGLPPPSRATVNQRFLDARGEMPLDDIAPSVAIDHVALEMPVRMRDTAGFVVLSAMVDLPSGQVLGHELSQEAPTAAAAARLIEAQLRLQGGGEPVPLRLNAPNGRDWDALLAVLATGGVETVRSPDRSLHAGSTLLRIFGDRLDRFRLRPRLTSRPSSARPKLRGDMNAPLTIEEARTVVESAIAASNAGREMRPARHLIAPERVEPLTQALRALT